MRFAIIGLGIQGRKRRNVAGSNAVVSIDPIVGGADFQQITEVNPETFDAACVCVPDNQKVQLLEQLLSKRKHVMVEKPLLGSPAQIKELIRLARTNNTTCYTAYNHRFEPHIVNLKRIVDSNALGQIYLAKFFYGNGTARDVRNSPWRDNGLGVLSDLGSHLIDIAHFLFGPHKSKGELWAWNRFENNAPDHVLFGYRGSPDLEMEATFLSWRNSFRIDLFGELGSAHIDGLCKWGPSTLRLRKRRFPSGVPKESVEVIEARDPTWQLEHDYFIQLCRSTGCNLVNDLWINEKLHELSFPLNGSVHDHQLGNQTN